MLTKSSIEPDQASDHGVTAREYRADVHETNGLIYTYRLHCAVGNIGGADEAKRNMYRRARKLMRRQEASNYEYNRFSIFQSEPAG